MFLNVCEAVQHAHQKAIIHRDIKPSNILVAYEGEQAIPMIIDFGVAKALTQPLTERTLVTEQAQMIGTVEYMSPEQAEMTSQDIDTRTDIYSLGVLLYELLTGMRVLLRVPVRGPGSSPISNPYALPCRIVSLRIRDCYSFSTVMNLCNDYVNRRVRFRMLGGVGGRRP